MIGRRHPPGERRFWLRRRDGRSASLTSLWRRSFGAGSVPTTFGVRESAHAKHGLSPEPSPAVPHSLACSNLTRWQWEPGTPQAALPPPVGLGRGRQPRRLAPAPYRA